MTGHWPLERQAPLVSVVIPTLGRDAQLMALISRIPEVAGWDRLEIIVERDAWPTPAGLPLVLKRGIARATGEFLCFLGNDCVPDEGFIREALEVMYTRFPSTALRRAVGDRGGPSIRHSTSRRSWRIERRGHEGLQGSPQAPFVRLQGCEFETEAIQRDLALGQ